MTRQSCKIEGCGRAGKPGWKGKPCFPLGFCAFHYARQYNTGSTEPVRYAQLGQRSHPLYYTWHNMIRRCRNITNKDYKYYGGRGIKVCDRWTGVYGFKNFLEDMGGKPDGYTLDRIDTDGNYGPDNCRWATWKTQANNRRLVNTESIGGMRNGNSNQPKIVQKTKRSRQSTT